LRLRGSQSLKASFAARTAAGEPRPDLCGNAAIRQPPQVRIWCRPGIVCLRSRRCSSTTSPTMRSGRSKRRMSRRCSQLFSLLEVLGVRGGNGLSLGLPSHLSSDPLAVAAGGLSRRAVQEACAADPGARASRIMAQERQFRRRRHDCGVRTHPIRPQFSGLASLALRDGAFRRGDGGSDPRKDRVDGPVAPINSARPAGAWGPQEIFLYPPASGR
jgi:hypothetical protein